MTGTGRRVGVGRVVGTALALALLGLAPLAVAREDWLNLGVVFFLLVALAQSWNVMGGLAGQVNLGHAAFFGLGALAARQLWAGGVAVPGNGSRPSDDGSSHTPIARKTSTCPTLPSPPLI